MVVLREKEEQIQQLLEEGEKLSKTQLQHTTIIKKLRAKEKENESHMITLKYVQCVMFFFFKFVLLKCSN